MLQAIVERAQRAIDTLVSKYVTRVVVAVPFVIALGFGTAAASVKLTELYGNLVAHTVLAATFAAAGLAAAAAIALSGPAPVAVVSEETTGQATVAEEASEAATGPESELLLSAIGALGPAAMPGLLRFLLANVPLLVGVAVLAYLLFSEEPATGDTAST